MHVTNSGEDIRSFSLTLSLSLFKAASEYLRGKVTVNQKSEAATKEITRDATSMQAWCLPTVSEWQITLYMQIWRGTDLFTVFTVLGLRGSAQISLVAHPDMKNQQSSGLFSLIGFNRYANLDDEKQTRRNDGLLRISCTHSVVNKLEIRHVSPQMYMFLLTYLNQALHTIVHSIG